MEFSARYLLAGVFVLATLFGVFAFIYWLTNSSGIGETTPYRIRFSVPVSGLSNGSDVLFNGIKIGEVSTLRFDQRDPEITIAEADLAISAPIYADTTVGIAFQGLTGAASILMSGGSEEAGAPPAGPDGIPDLTADPTASRSWTDNAGRLLGRLDEMLSRNSGRFDAIFAGLERLAGGGTGEAEEKTYDLPVPDFPQAEPVPPGLQLVVSEPTVLLSMNTDNIQISREDGSLAELGSAQWTDNLPNLIQAKLIRAFENAGNAGSILRPADVFEPDFRLAVDIRDFHLSSDDPPFAEARLMAKLFGPGGQIMDTKLFEARLEASSAGKGDGVEAMRLLFLQLSADIVKWTSGALQSAGEDGSAEE